MHNDAQCYAYSVYTFKARSINKLIRMGNRRGKWKHLNMVNESVEYIMLWGGWCTVLFGIRSGGPNPEKGKW